MDRRLEITEFLSSFITDHKRELIESVLAQRTNYITIALEDIYQPHNASAVVRTADCFGIQKVHIIEGRNKYDTNPQVLRGSEKWVDIVKYEDHENNTKSCFDNLKAQGFSLIGTTPHKDGVSLADFNLNQPMALIFGTEETGLSDYARQHVDGFIRIPMYGFTESFNLSVSAAICLYQLMNQLHKSNFDYLLGDEQKIDLRLSWYKKVVRRSDALINEYLLTSNS